MLSQSLGISKIWIVIQTSPTECLFLGLPKVTQTTQWQIFISELLISGQVAIHMTSSVMQSKYNQIRFFGVLYRIH